MSTASGESDKDCRDTSAGDSTRHKVRRSRKQRDANQNNVKGNNEEDDEAFLADNDDRDSEHESKLDVDLDESSTIRYYCGNENEERFCVSRSSCLIPVAEESHFRRGKNKSFNNFEVREIERKNSILLNRIITQQNKPSEYKVKDIYYQRKKSNSEVNRNKKQFEIDRQNLLLLKKIQNVKPFGLSIPKK